MLPIMKTRPRGLETVIFNMASTKRARCSLSRQLPALVRDLEAFGNCRNAVVATHTFRIDVVRIVNCAITSEVGIESELVSRAIKKALLTRLVKLPDLSLPPLHEK